MAIRTYGTMGVDWEQRIDFDRLRRDRLTRIKALLAKSELGALLCFDMNNVRYITATHIGTWAQDKISRFTLLPQHDEPILWDFGSAAKHHQLNCPWLGDRSRAGIASSGSSRRRGTRQRRDSEPRRTRTARRARIQSRDSATATSCARHQVRCQARDVARCHMSARQPRCAIIRKWLPDGSRKPASMP